MSAGPGGLGFPTFGRFPTNSKSGARDQFSLTPLGKSWGWSAQVARPKCLNLRPSAQARNAQRAKRKPLLLKQWNFCYPGFVLYANCSAMLCIIIAELTNETATNCHALVVNFTKKKWTASNPAKEKIAEKHSTRPEMTKHQPSDDYCQSPASTGGVRAADGHRSGNLASHRCHPRFHGSSGGALPRLGGSAGLAAESTYCTYKYNLRTAHSSWINAASPFITMDGLFPLMMLPRALSLSTKWNHNPSRKFSNVCNVSKTAALSIAVMCARSNVSIPN